MSQKISWSENCHFRNNSSLGWWSSTHTCFGKYFEDKGKDIEKKNYQRILSTMVVYTKARCHMRRGEFFSASKSEIAWGQAILGGEDCNVPIQINA